MAEVERLLEASAIEVAACDPAVSRTRGPAFGAYVNELAAGSTAASTQAAPSADDAELTAGRPAAGRQAARQPVGCGALKFHGTEPAEIKRMWVTRSVRGLGLGRRLLAELEALAAAAGARAVRLETNRSLTEAIAMYRSAGYAEVAPFNDEPYAHHWFEKDLADS